MTALVYQNIRGCKGCRICAKADRGEDCIAELLRQVGLEPCWRARYPHALSGGQRQRIGYMCDRVAAMYRGRVVELGSTEQVVEAPAHACTLALLSAIPRPGLRARRIHPRFRYQA